jgi:formate dehydrogenase major subunit
MRIVPTVKSDSCPPLAAVDSMHEIADADRGALLMCKLSNEMNKQVSEQSSDSGSDADACTRNLPTISRRDWFRAGVGAAAGLAVGEFIDVRAIRAATQTLKLANISEFTTSCNFCSCGCGMIAAVRDGKLIAMEGDYDHIVNRGSLCVKGISMFATHTSPKRLTTPRYRAPGSDHWEEITWKDAVERVARKIKTVREQNWVATEKLGDREVPVNRTDAIAFLGGAQNTNEECYLFQKAARLLGMPFVEHQARL